MLDIENRDPKTINDLSEALSAHGFFTITNHELKMKSYLLVMILVKNSSIFLMK